MAKMQKKSLDSPDERRKFEKGHVDVATLGGVTFGEAHSNQAGSGRNL